MDDERVAIEVDSSGRVHAAMVRRQVRSAGGTIVAIGVVMLALVAATAPPGPFLETFVAQAVTVAFVCAVVFVGLRGNIRVRARTGPARVRITADRAGLHVETPIVRRVTAWSAIRIEEALTELRLHEGPGSV